MNKKSTNRTKIITVIAILTLLGGIIGVISSFPLYNVLTALYRGGTVEQGGVTITSVMPNTPAAQAGFKPNDIVTSADGQAIHISPDLITFSHTHLGQPISLTISRNGTQQTIVVTSRTTYPPNQGPLGIAIADYKVVKQPTSVLIPLTIFRSYIGYEENFSDLFGPIDLLTHTSTPYYDKSLSRLRQLVVGILTILIGIGLLKMKKWAAYGFLLITGIGVILQLIGIIQLFMLFFATGTGSVVNVDVPPAAAPNLATIIALIGLVIEIWFILYIYSIRKLFS